MEIQFFTLSADWRHAPALSKAISYLVFSLSAYQIIVILYHQDTKNLPLINTMTLLNQNQLPKLRGIKKYCHYYPLETSSSTQINK